MQAIQSTLSIRWRRAAVLCLAITGALPGATPCGRAASTNTTAAMTPAWGNRSIADIPATTKVQPVDTTSRDPALAALQRLNYAETNQAASAPSTIPNSRIADIEVPRVLNDTDINNRFERAKVEGAILEAEDLVRLGQTARAVANLTNLLTKVALDTSKFSLNHRIGSYLFRLQQYRAAAGYMEKALTFQPNNPAEACNLAATLMTIGEFDKAQRVLEAIQINLIENRNLRFSVFFNLACVNSLKGNKTDAIEHLYQAARQDPVSTLASQGDPQIDAIRRDARVMQLFKSLETPINP